MKFLKKVNKGVALTVIILVILIIYLINVEVSRNKEKTNIETACKEYIEFINEYAVMPEANQKIYNALELNENEQIKLQNEANKSITLKMDEFEKRLNGKTIDNELTIKMQRERLEECLKEQNDIFNKLITKFNKEIIKIKKFKFDDNQVTVTFASKVEEEIKSLDSENKEVSKIESFNNPEETITFQNVDGKWKVVYADLQYYNYSLSSYSGVTTTVNL